MRMYVAALAHPLSVEYLLLDHAQYMAAKDHPDGLFAFVQQTPGLEERAPRFHSLAALRRHCVANGIEIVGDLHGCLGEKGPARAGSGML